MSEALASVWSRYQAQIQTISSVYSSSYKGSDVIQDKRKEVDEFAAQEGRRPRILVVKLGQDGHDRGSKVIATGLADLGFDVDIGPLFQTPDEAAKMAVENDVHVVGVSSQAAAHLTLVPELSRALKAAGAEDILIVVGGIIPDRDYEKLREAGASAIFGPGTPIPECASQIISALKNQKSRGKP